MLVRVLGFIDYPPHSAHCSGWLPLPSRQFDAIAGDVYPELYQKFVSKLNLVNLDLDFVLAYSCLFTNDFYDHLLFATITPFLALVFLAGSYFIGKKRNSSSESAMLEVRHKHQAAVLYVALLVYSPVSYRIFQTFGCDELDDGESYLRADYSLSCLTARHSRYEVYAFIMVGIYPVGIAAAFAGLLFWHRHDLVKPDRGTMLHLKPSNGVWAAYRPSPILLRGCRVRSSHFVHGHCGVCPCQQRSTGVHRIFVRGGVRVYFRGCVSVSKERRHDALPLGKRRYRSWPARTWPSL